MKLLWLLSLAASLTAQVRFAKDANGDISVQVDGKPFTTFHPGVEANKPYLYPLLTADGKNITRRWPQEQNTGESHDHLHHRGLWFSYDEVNGVKFWANDPSYAAKDPHIGKQVVAKTSFKDGSKAGTLTADIDWTAPDGNVLLHEKRVMTFHASPPEDRVIDFDTTLTAGSEKVAFGDTKEGAFAIRLADPLSEKKTGHMVNAEGKQGMKEVWGKRSNWVDYSGALDGEQVGVAIFDSPKNPGHPVYWHSRDYGLFALDPFGRHAFDPSQPESKITLDPGQSMRFRWRVVIHPGDAESAHIGALYDKWIH